MGGWRFMMTNFLWFWKQAWMTAWVWGPVSAWVLASQSVVMMMSLSSGTAATAS